MRRRRIVLGLAAVAALALAVVFVARDTRPAAAHEADGAAVPTTAIERGTLELTVHMKGSVRASRQQAIMAPTVGGALRILSLVESGTAVEAGDVILEFDPADQRYALEQAQSEVLEAEQEIRKRRADVDAQAAQDKVALLTAQFNVRRAELDAAVDQDLIPANEHKIRQVSLEEARRTLVQTEQDVQARRTTGQAGLAVLQEKRAKATAAADRARQNIESLSVKAPMNGVLSVRENVDASGGVLFSGMTLPAYRVGDTVNPGRPVVDLVDVSGLEIRAAVNEQDRVNLSTGQAVRVESALLARPLGARVTAISGQSRSRSGPLREFEVTLVLDAPDDRLRPGTTVDLIAPGERVDNVLLLPRQAVFELEGKPVVYVRTAGGFEPRPIAIRHRTESRVAFDGLEPSLAVALVDPTTLSTGRGRVNATGPVPGATR
jgi:HlyD family secretion protein